MFVTLDGVVRAPGGPEEGREGGFPHGAGSSRSLTGTPLAKSGKASSEWNNARLIQDNLAEAVNQIKVNHGDVYVIDSGKCLFNEGVNPSRFKLKESRASESGAVLMTYESDGKPAYGTM